MASFADTFTRADSGTLGANWTQSFGCTGISSNQAVAGGTSADECVWSADNCDSSDNFAEFTAEAMGTVGYRVVKVLCRANGAGTAYTFNLVYSGGWERRLIRRVSDSDTTLDYDYSSVSLPATMRIEADGSTITAYWNGNQLFQETDTTITSGTRVGLMVYAGNLTAPAPAVDDWSGGDITSATNATATPTVVSATAAVDGSGWATRDSLIVMGGASKTGRW